MPFVRARPLGFFGAKPKRRAQPELTRRVLGAAKPRPTSGGKAERMLVRTPEAKLCGMELHQRADKSAHAKAAQIGRVTATSERAYEPNDVP